VQILLALIVLLVLALAAGPLSHGRISRLSRDFLTVGAEFLLLGWALGAMGLLDADSLAALRPLTTLGLSWIGLLLGLQFELRQLRKLPAAFHALGAAQGFLTLLIVSIAFYPLLVPLFGAGMDTQAAALLLGAAAADSSQDMLALALRGRRRNPHAPVHLYRYAAALDSVMPVGVLVLLSGVQHGRGLMMAPTETGGAPSDGPPRPPGWA